MKKLSVIDEWVNRLVFRINDTPELTQRKKFFLITNLIAIFFLTCVTILAHQLGLINLAWHIFMLLAFAVLQTLLLLILRKLLKWFIYAVFSAYIILIFSIIISLGGIANSAGLLMAAYFFLLTAQWMEDTRLLLFVGALYVIGVLVAGISYPYLQIDQDLAGWKNNLFFAINFGWIGLLIALALYSTIVRSEKAAKSRADQLQELDLLKSKLYANIAHEFKTPLTLIKGNASEVSQEHPGEISERANSIINNADKILYLVNQILDLSKVEEGNVPVRFIQTNLVGFIKNIVGKFQPYAGWRKIELHFQSQTPVLMMDIDAEKLEESVSNLISNAIKYTPESGEVTVGISTQEGETGNDAEKKVEISVCDTGIGIPEDQLDKIFIRFYRVEDKRFPYQEGTGIGLTLVHEYLKLMNGSIKVNSSPGRGSEFIITLPVTRNAPVENVVELKSAFMHHEKKEFSHFNTIESGFGLPRLLIIEDNRELKEYLKGFLCGEYLVIEAEDGTQGVEQAIEHIPDIILSDIMMPGKDGYQVCSELKKDLRTNHIPLVLLTARADTDSRLTGLECGANAYLTKPFDKKELMACLHNLFVQREKLRLKYQTKLYNTIPEEVADEMNAKFLNNVIKILEKNYRNEKFRIDDLLLQLGISRVQLHRKLSALTGQSTSGFIRSFRLFKARKLLMESSKNVSEIAYETGFSDPNYFTRAFTGEYGITPSDTRKQAV